MDKINVPDEFLEQYVLTEVSKKDQDKSLFVEKCALNLLFLRKWLILNKKESDIVTSIKWKVYRDGVFSPTAEFTIPYQVYFALSALRAKENLSKNFTKHKELKQREKQHTVKYIIGVIDDQLVADAVKEIVKSMDWNKVKKELFVSLNTDSDSDSDSDSGSDSDSDSDSGEEEMDFDSVKKVSKDNKTTKKVAKRKKVSSDSKEKPRRKEAKGSRYITSMEYQNFIINKNGPPFNDEVRKLTEKIKGNFENLKKNVRKYEKKPNDSTVRAISDYTGFIYGNLDTLEKIKDKDNRKDDIVKGIKAVKEEITRVMDRYNYKASPSSTQKRKPNPSTPRNETKKVKPNLVVNVETPESNQSTISSPMSVTSDKSESLDNITAIIANSLEKINNLETALSEKDNEIKKKDEELRKKHEELKKKDEELRKKHEELKQKDDELKQKDKELKQKDEELKKKEDELRKKKNKHKKDPKLNDLVSQLKQKLK